MADVSTSLPFATIEAELREYIGIPTGEDLRLSLQWAGTTSWVDNYLNNPFVDDDEVDIPIPDAVKLACYQIMLQLKAVFARTAGLFNIKTGDLSETYSLFQQGKDIGPASFETAARTTKPLLWRHRKRWDL